MTTTIDNRIVDMQFNNSQFEKGTKETVKSIAELKASLNFDKSVGALSGLSNAFSGLGKSGGFGNITDGISVFETVAFSAIQRITDKVVDLGLTLAKSLMIDPIALGYADYGRKITSIQTITNATGKSIDEVNTYFSELDEYADKTVYNLDDMTGAMAKFTNAGVSLDTAVPAIKGIANMTALAGQDANAAGIAYYNLSQSIAGGYLTTMDYRSLNLANIATNEWKQHMVDAAVAAGTLTKTKEGLYKTDGMKEAVSMQKLFNEQLSEGWATTDVLMTVLGDYGDTTTEIGKKAQASAQDVKSWGMMMETLKASVGTGWTDTFEILIGDLTDAKALFTPLTETVQELLNIFTDSRNNLLQGWSDLGGRTDLIEAFKNSFYGIKELIVPITEALSEIFPPLTSGQIFGFTNGLKELTEKFKMAAKPVDEIKRIFKGVFAIIDIGRMAVVALASGFGKILKAILPAGDGVLDFLAFLSDYIVKLRDSIKNGDAFMRMVNGISKVFKKISTDIGTFVKAIKSSFEEFKSTLNTKGVVESFKGAISNFLSFFTTADIAAVSSFVEKFKERFAPLAVVADFIQSLVDKIKSFAKKIWEATAPIREAIQKAKTAIGEAVTKLFNSILDYLANLDFSNVKFDTIFDGLNLALTAGMYLSFKKLFNKGDGVIGGVEKLVTNIADAVGGSNDILKKVSEALTGVKDTLVAYQEQIKAGIILKIAYAVGIFAISLVAISMIDSEKLSGALAALSVLFALIIGALTNYQAMSTGISNASLAGSVMGMIGMAVAVLLLTAAMQKLAVIDPEGLTNGLQTIGILLLLMVGVSKRLEGANAQVLAASVSMIAFAFAIGLLVKPVETIGAIDDEILKKGLFGIGVLIAEIVLFLNNVKVKSSMIKTVIAIYLLGLALEYLAKVVEKFGEIDQQKMEQGLKVLGYILLELALFTRFSTGDKGFVKTAIGTAILAGALMILTQVITALGLLDIATLAKGLVSMGLAFAVITIAMAYMPKDMLTKAIGLAIVAASLFVLAKVLSGMGSMSWEEIARGLVLLGGALTIIAIGLSFMSQSVVGSIALILAAKALSMLAVPLAVLGAMSLAAVGTALLALAGVFIILGVAASLLTPVMPMLFALGAVMLIIGLAALALGAGALALSGGLATLSVSGAAGAAALVIILTSLVAILPIMAVAIGKAIIAFATEIKEGAPEIFAAVSAIIMGFIKATVENIPLMVEAALTLVDSLFKAIADKLPSIIDSGYAILLAFMNGVLDNISEITTVGYETAIAFLDAVALKLPELVDSGYAFIISFIDGLTAGVTEHMPNLIVSITQLATEILKGLVMGLMDSDAIIKQALWDLGKLILDNFKEALGIASPSTKFIELAGYIIEGLVTGIVDNTLLIVNSIFALIDAILAQFEARLVDFVIMGLTLIVKVIRGLNNSRVQLVNAAKELINKVISAIKSKYNSLADSGRHIIEGLIEGINDYIGKVTNAAANLAQSLIDVVNDILGVESPATSMISTAKYVVEGLVVGINTYKKRAFDSAGLLAEGVVNPFATVSQRIQDSLNESIDVAPVVSPVLNLDAIKKGGKELASIFDNTDVGMALSKSSKLAGSISLAKSNHEPRRSDRNTGKTDEPGQVIFNQNNYSPKVLNTVEIYRQTKNQISRIKR